MFPPSKEAAANRLRSLERKLDNDTTYAKIYYDEIERLIHHGYAVRVDNNEINPNKEWYLPHFGVKNPNKPKRVRVVFDATAKTRGVNLNDKLLAGSDLLASLFEVLLRLMKERVAYTGDIKDTFLRVSVRTEDRSSQLFLYRGEARDRQPDTFAMTTLVFGARSSPCSAIHVKNVNAE